MLDKNNWTWMLKESADSGISSSLSLASTHPVFSLFICLLFVTSSQASPEF